VKKEERTIEYSQALSVNSFPVEKERRRSQESSISSELERDENETKKKGRSTYISQLLRGK